MPIAAIVDEQVFCAHGGIPTTSIHINQLISSVPCPMVDPEFQSPQAWEVLWNDPITNEDYANLKSMFFSHNGFMSNNKRGTAYFFSEEAVNNFLQVNDLSHVIRAHELVQSGFRFHCEGRVITVFSCSKYCGCLNDAALLMLDSNKIRVVKVDTK